MCKYCGKKCQMSSWMLTQCITFSTNHAYDAALKTGQMEIIFEGNIIILPYQCKCFQSWAVKDVCELTPLWSITSIMQIITQHFQKPRPKKTSRLLIHKASESIIYEIKEVSNGRFLFVRLIEGHKGFYLSDVRSG